MATSEGDGIKLIEKSNGTSAYGISR